MLAKFLSIRVWQLIAFAAIACLNTAAVGQFSKADELFATKVKPLLAQKCFSCHGDDPEELEAELNLTSLEGMLAGGDASAGQKFKCSISGRDRRCSRNWRRLLVFSSIRPVWTGRMEFQISYKAFRAVK